MSSKKNMKQHPSPSKPRPKGKKKDFQQTLALVDRLGSMQLKLFRRLVGSTAVSTNAGGLIPITTIASSVNVNAYGDFSGLAGLYNSYRVHAFKLTFWPVYKVNTTAVTSPVFVACAPFRGGLTPTTMQQLQESPDCAYMSGYDRGVSTVNYNGDNDAHLWTPTNAAVTSSETFGLAICGSTIAATASTQVWYIQIEAVVEFRVTG